MTSGLSQPIFYLDGSSQSEPRPRREIKGSVEGLRKVGPAFLTFSITLWALKSLNYKYLSSQTLFFSLEL